MKKLKHLCEAIRAISPFGELRLIGTPEDLVWRGSVSVGGVILIESQGDLEVVVDELNHKLERMSQRMLAKLSSDLPPANSFKSSF